MSRCAKIFSIVLLISVAASFILRLCFHFWAVFVNSAPNNSVDSWLEDNQLAEYKQVFKNKGERKLRCCVLFLLCGVFKVNHCLNVYHCCLYLRPHFLFQLFF